MGSRCSFSTWTVTVVVAVTQAKVVIGGVGLDEEIDVDVIVDDIGVHGDDADDENDADDVEDVPRSCGCGCGCLRACWSGRRWRRGVNG